MKVLAYYFIFLPLNLLSRYSTAKVLLDQETLASMQYFKVLSHLEPWFDDEDLSSLAELSGLFMFSISLTKSIAEVKSVIHAARRNFLLHKHFMYSLFLLLLFFFHFVICMVWYVSIRGWLNMFLQFKYASSLKENSHIIKSYNKMIH